jgi:microcystin-dependent protein
MAYSFAQYAGDGSNTIFSVPFPYLSKTHVIVSVNGVETTAFTWLTSASIQLTTAPSAGAVVDIRRKSSRDARLVDFQDASLLTEEILDQDANQHFYLAQEAFDDADNSVQLALDGVFDAESKRIKNVAEPTSLQDAVTKNYVDSTTAASAAAAAASADTATAKAAEAATSLSNFKSQYLGDAATAPTVDGNGAALTAGDIYFDTVSNTMQVYTGAAWQAAAISDANLVHKTGDESIAGVKTFSSSPLVPAGATGDQVGQVQEVAPPGAVTFFARSSAPAGWLKANGATISRTTYTALFNAIGTTFGAGDGSTTFSLPDLRGEFLRGWDDGRGVDGGRAFGNAQTDQNASHTHTGSTSTTGSHTHAQHLNTLVNANHAGLYGSGTFGSQGYSTDAAGDHSHSLTINSSGGNESRPRNVSLLACIKY